MPILEVDLSEVDTTIDPGTYPGKVIEVDVQTSKSGNPMAVTKFELNVGGTRRVRKTYLVTKGAGAFNFYGLLKSTGFAELAEKLKSGEKVPFNTDSLIGQECHVVVTEELYNGEKRDKISSFLPA